MPHRHMHAAMARLAAHHRRLNVISFTLSPLELPRDRLHKRRIGSSGPYGPDLPVECRSLAAGDGYALCLYGSEAEQTVTKWESLPPRLLASLEVVSLESLEPKGNLDLRADAAQRLPQPLFDTPQAICDRPAAHFQD